MKDFLTKWGWLGIVEGILITVVGILTAIFGGLDSDKYSNTIAIIVAVFLFIDGAIFLLKSILNYKKSLNGELFAGALLIGIGVFLCTSSGPNTLKVIVPIFVAVSLLAIAAGSLMKGIAQAVTKQGLKNVLVSIVFFVVSGVLGTLALVFKDQGTLAVTYVLLGIALAVLGIFEICFSGYAIRKGKDLTKDPKKE